MIDLIIFLGTLFLLNLGFKMYGYYLDYQHNRNKNAVPKAKNQPPPPERGAGDDYPIIDLNK